MSLADKNIIEYIENKKQQKEAYWDFKTTNSKDIVLIFKKS